MRGSTLVNPLRGNRFQALSWSQLHPRYHRAPGLSLQLYRHNATYELSLRRNVLLLVCIGTISVRAILPFIYKHVSVQEDLSQQEEVMAALESPEASTEEQASHEEGFMTMDAVPELVQMMTDIQAALTEPEESADLESPTNEAQDMVQGNFWA